jgi:hypothetical protein
MGTNFYWVRRENAAESDEDAYDERASRHIGKRSAAGLYCWDCCMTLCRGGEAQIHRGDGWGEERSRKWYDTCPRCGQGPAPKTAGEVLERGPVAVELGFGEPETARPTGVAGCASFSWEVEPTEVRDYCRRHPDEHAIIDEYGRVMTCAEFLAMLAANCPVEITEMIGWGFS